MWPHCSAWFSTPGVKVPTNPLTLEFFDGLGWRKNKCGIEALIVWRNLSFLLLASLHLRLPKA